MYSLLRLLPFYFIFVALPRVAIYANRFTIPGPEWLQWNPYNILGILFAIGLGTGVMVMSYFSNMGRSDADLYRNNRDLQEMSAQQQAAWRRKVAEGKALKIAARRAATAAVVFAILDGLFNLAEVASVAIDTGHIQGIVSPANGNIVGLISVWAFGLVPTFSSFMTAWVMGAVDRTSEIKAKASSMTWKQVLVALFAGDQAQTAQVASTTARRTTRRKKSGGKKNAKARFMQDVSQTKATIADLRANVDEIVREYGASKRTVFRWIAEVENNA